MLKLDRNALIMLALCVFACGAAGAQPIVQSRGYDAQVDYAAMVAYGPWDDRNYQLRASDLELLGDHERERRPGVPLFYRIELLRKQPVLRDPARRYPRSALNRFRGTYGGLLVDGKLYRHVEVVDGVIRVDESKGIDKEEFDELGMGAFFKANGWSDTVFRPGAETAVKFRPGSSRVAVAGINDEVFGQTMARTRNGGRTWDIAAGADPFAGSCCDPTVDWSSDGRKAYTATLQASGAEDVWVYRSRNNGRTWTDLPGNDRTELGDTATDKEFLHVDKHASSPFRDRVYLCWHNGNVQRFAFSADQAVSFTKRTVSSGNGELGIGCDLTSDTNGRLYYFWPAFNSQRILFRRSNNGGASFQATRTIANTEAEFAFPIPAMQQREAFVYVAADTDVTNGPFADSIYAAWTDSTSATSSQANQNHARIRVARSRDGGATWQVNSPHPTGDSNSVDRFHPWLAVGPDGVVHVIYYDTGRSSNRRSVDAFHAFSSDGGQTWTRERMTDSLAPRINDGFQFGDYNGMDAAGARLLATWTGTRNNAAVGRAGRRND